MQNKPHHVKTVEEAILHPSALYGFGNALDPSPLHVQKSSGSRLGTQNKDFGAGSQLTIRGIKSAIAF